MLIIPEPKHRRRRAARKPPTPPVASGPVLVAAGYDDVTGTLSLTFDRAIDVSGFVPALVVVDDGGVPIELGGTADVSQPGANSMTVAMIENGEFAGTGVTLTVTGGAGIVASDGGAAWAGVAGLELPFP